MKEIQILFDACIGEPVMKRVADLLAFEDTSIRLLHCRSFFREGASDEVIVRRAKAEGWIVITGDRAKRGRKEMKMPVLCQRIGVTHILMTAAVHELDSVRKAGAILDIANLFPHVAAQPAGRRFRLQATPAGSARLYDADLKVYVRKPG